MTNNQMKKFIEKYGISQIDIAKEVKLGRSRVCERLKKPGTDKTIEAAVIKLTKKKFKNIKDLLSVLEQ